jgi:hypothetical protein
MKALGRVLSALLTVTTACGTATIASRPSPTSAAAESFYPTTSASIGFTVDMSMPLTLHGDCGTPRRFPSLEAEIDDWRAQGDDVVLARVLDILPAAWNTPTGTRPTQHDVDTGLTPWIYRPIRIAIERTWPPSPPRTIEVLLSGGTINADTTTGCPLHSRPTKNNLFLLFLGTTTSAAGTTAPLIDDSYQVIHKTAATWYGPRHLPT